MGVAPIIIDFETRSGVDLTKVGVANYMRDPDYCMVCAVAALPAGNYVTILHGQNDPDSKTGMAELAAAVEAGHPVLAHNAAGFDSHVWNRERWPKPPGGWIDALPLARRLGLPGHLDLLGNLLYGEGKDKAGRALTLSLSRYDKHGKLPPLTFDVLTKVAAYCRRDVTILRRLWNDHLSEVVVPEMEEYAVTVDTIVNLRGVQLDLDLARAVVRCCDEIAAKARSRVPEADRRMITSPKALRSWLACRGYDVPDTTATTVESLLEDPGLPEDVRAVLLARVASAPNTARRLRSALNHVEEDGRVRNMFAFHGCHTGRWSGRGLQPQNLPRGIPVDIEAAIAAARRIDLDALEHLAASEAVQSVKPGAGMENVLTTLVRPCLRAKDGHLLVAADYSQIEARALLWLAGDDAGLEVFRRGEDLYKVTAAQLYGVAPGDVSREQRQVGKVPNLGAGYGLGPDGLRAFADNMGLDLDAAGVTAEFIVDGWRDANLSVAGNRTGETYNGRPCRQGGLWKDVEAAAVRAVTVGGVHTAGRCSWFMREGCLVAQLPSGRELVYWDMRPVYQPTPWGGEKPALEYALHRGRVRTFGARLVENICQAVCRDLLADAVVKTESAGLHIVLHVHDEIVCEVPAVEADAALEQLLGIMQERGPAWAAGLPIAAEGYMSPYYKKG